jgi:hypothetical protein
MALNNKLNHISFSSFEIIIDLLDIFIVIIIIKIYYERYYNVCNMLIDYHSTIKGSKINTLHKIKLKASQKFFKTIISQNK